MNFSMSQTKKATFGAGCFWGVEELFRTTPGVISTAVGYEGGSTERPTYEQVCADNTGHAEVVEVEFDPDKVTYERLLELFWANHNPSTLNRQGPDVGTQYRSVIFVHDDAQRAIAEASLAKVNSEGKWKGKVVTTIEPAKTFWKAEDYHQQYLAKRGLSTCHI